MITDLISDMLTRIRNATFSRHKFTYIMYSKVNVAILSILVKEGYIKQFLIQKLNHTKKIIRVSFKYGGWWIKKNFFSMLKRISTPGQRIFLNYKNFTKKLPNLKYKQGLAIISTSIGIMSHKKAMKLRKGGEILCYIE